MYVPRIPPEHPLTYLAHDGSILEWFDFAPQFVIRWSVTATEFKIDPATQKCKITSY
jgi:hypothetical protein